MNLATGTFSSTEIDLAFPAPGFSWVIARASTRNIPNPSDSNHYTLPIASAQGYNWYQLSQPKASLEEGAFASQGLLTIQYQTDGFLQFLETTSGSGIYLGIDGVEGAVQRVVGTGDDPDTLEFYDLHGMVSTFFAPDDARAGDAAGYLWRVVDAAGNTAWLGHPTVAEDAAANGYSADGIVQAVDSADRKYFYEYDDVDTLRRLVRVIVKTKTGGSWASGTETGVAEVGRVEYGYYDTDQSDKGLIGDLRTARVELPLSDTSLKDVRTRYYRYYTSTSTAPKMPHMMKMVVSAEGVRKYDLSADSQLDGDYLAASDGDLKPYSEQYLEYISETDPRISSFFSNGECGCGSQSNGVFELAYTKNTSGTWNSAYQTAWRYRTVVEQPDGTYISYYTDELYQPWAEVTTSSDPGTGTPSLWVTQYVRDAETARTEERWTPAAISGYTHSTGSITQQSSQGLVHLYEYFDSGPLEGRLFNEKWKIAGGTAYLVSTTYYTMRSFEVDELIPDMPFTIDLILPWSQWEYTQETTTTSGSSAASGSNEYKTSYGFHSDTATNVQYLVLKSRTDISPKVATSANGRGNATEDPAVERKTFYRADGTVAFSQGEAYADETAANRVYRYTQYGNGQMVKSIEDATTNGSFASGDDPYTNFGITEASTGLNITTTYTYDAQGRSDTTTLPNGRVTKNYYTRLSNTIDGRMVALSIPRIVSGGSTTYYGPVSYGVRNLSNRPDLVGTIAISSSGSTTSLDSWIDETEDDLIEAVDVGTLARMATTIYNSAGTRVDETRAYFDIPANGAGSAGTNYDKTIFGYDEMGRRRRTKIASGTITRTVFDAMGRQTESWIGTNDNGLPGGESSGTSNMTKTSVVEYDGGNDKGNSYVTEVVLDADGNWGTTTDQRVTSFTNDVRGRAVLLQNPLSPHTVSLFDNLGRTVATGMYSDLTGFTISTNPTIEDEDRLGLDETSYDTRGQAWKKILHKIDASDGSDDDNVVSLFWFDPQGRVIKSRDSVLSKTRYDRLDRVTHRFTLAKDNDSSYSSVFSSAQTDVAGDDVLEESQTTYDLDTGNVLMQATISRFHDDLASAGSGTAGALDTNADGLRLKYTASDVKGRIQITASWYDNLDRPSTSCSFGTAGSGNASDFNYSGMAIPTRSDTQLVTTYSYNDDGTVLDVTDPRGKIARTLYDDLGRTTATIANYLNGTPSGDNSDDDNYTRLVYSSGLQTKMWVDLDGDNVEDGTDQVTTYTYGTVMGTSAGESNIAAGHLLQKVTYPDSASGSDVVTFAYNAQSQQMWQQDQAGNVIQADYDVAGRETQRRATTINTGAGFSDAVKRIATAYTNRSQVLTVTQYDHATVGSGTTTDEVKFTYDDWGNVSQCDQDRDSAVSGGGNHYTVSWAYAKASPSGAAEVVRCTGMTLPGSGDSASVTYTYESSSNSLDHAAGRVTNVQTGASPTTRASYKYLGLGQLVGTTLSEPDVYSRLYGSGAANYDALDRFNRVAASRWTKNGGREFYEVTPTYDRNSNIVTAVDSVVPGFDASYAMDGRNRLTRTEEGTWSGSAITSRTRDQQWSLSQPGNWYRNKRDLDGDGTFTGGGELDETNTFNVVNELTGRDTDSNSSDNYTPSYNAAGDMTDDGKDYTYVYDVFGRLVTVKTRGGSPTIVAEYRYNGLNWRISWHSDVTRNGGGDPDGTVDSYDPWYYTVHDTKWRMVAVFRGSDSNPKERFVWHAAGLIGDGGSSYIDTLLLRDQDANSGWTSAADGTLEARDYNCQNWRADVSFVLSSSGLMKEWIKYSAYGVPFRVDPADYNADGFVGGGDYDAFLADWELSESRADADFDAFVSGGDFDLYVTNFENANGGGGGVLSAFANRVGYAGYQFASELAGSKWHVRHRILNSELGRWNRRDPLEYVGGSNLYEYCVSTPVAGIDPYGLLTQANDGSGASDGESIAAQQTAPGCPPDIHERICRARKAMVQNCWPFAAKDSAIAELLQTAMDMTGLGCATYELTAVRQITRARGPAYASRNPSANRIAESLKQSGLDNKIRWLRAGQYWLNIIGRVTGVAGIGLTIWSFLQDPQEWQYGFVGSSIGLGIIGLVVTGPIGVTVAVCAIGVAWGQNEIANTVISPAKDIEYYSKRQTCLVNIWGHNNLLKRYPACKGIPCP